MIGLSRNMKMSLVIYLAVLTVFALGVSSLLHLGGDLSLKSSHKIVSSTETWARSAVHQAPGGGQASILSTLAENFKEPLARLLVQLIVIVLTTRAVGSLFVRFDQPAVVGEITAGILLGPSLLGWLWPDAFAFVFPKESLSVLGLFSQIGVCVFMFVVGMELDLAQLKQNARVAVVISHASIVVPYLFGIASALLLYPSFANEGSSFLAFALFMGIAMSITAFPVMVRIMEQRGIAKTPIGATAITCAAVGDATAWAILAFVVAIVRATEIVSTFLNLGLMVLFVVLMLWGVRPQLTRWLAVENMHGAGARSAFGAALILMTASALTTEIIGIHALFGAFLSGVVMPRQKHFREYLTVRLENFSSIFLLPVFFAFSGLRTQVRVLDDSSHWLVCIGIIAVATVGKLGGTTVTARLTGMSWNQAFSLGALMNTRGLVELVALNIGYDLGILSPPIFAMMVLMALATTFMTGPILTLTERAKRRHVSPVVADPDSI
jgi:Kef-type K+ transport system membrane component KefB